MNNKTLPIINKDQLAKAKEDSWDFLFLLIDPIHEMISSDDSGEIMNQLSSEQHTLLAFNALYGQVTNGGFIQLIQNGYGEYIFDNPFSEHVKKWGALEIGKIVDDAKIIYDHNKVDLEKETDLEGFSKMYEEFTEFEPLDDRFYEVMDDELEIIRKYVEDNLDRFAIVE